MKSQESQNIRITDNRGHGMLLIPWKVRVSRCTLREMQWVNTVSPNISRKISYVDPSVQCQSFGGAPRKCIIALRTWNPGEGKKTGRGATTMAKAQWRRDWIGCGGEMSSNLWFRSTGTNLIAVVYLNLKSVKSPSWSWINSRHQLSTRKCLWGKAYDSGSLMAEIAWHVSETRPRGQRLEIRDSRLKEMWG